MARKILLADDSVTAQNMGRKILTDAGYEVVTVNNGSAALKKIAEGKPDLIVLDVYMPGYSGLEVCQRIKENPVTARIPVLLTVGKLEPFKPEEARRARADAFVVKPFEASELLSALTKLEDKIIPQAEPYKQGRFAKAVASVDSAADAADGEKFGDSDAGWKARLRIPVGKPKDSDPDPDYAATQGKGFRDYVETPAKKTAPEAAVKSESVRPMPGGLPHDITPEEIAAITAAAAQLNGAPAPPVATPEFASETVPAAGEVVSSETAGPEEGAPVTFASSPQLANESEPVASEVPAEVALVVDAVSIESVPVEAVQMEPAATIEPEPVEASTIPTPAADAGVPEQETAALVEESRVAPDLEAPVAPITETPETTGSTPPAEIASTVVTEPATAESTLTQAANVSDDEVMAALQTLIPSASIPDTPAFAEPPVSDSPSAFAAVTASGSVTRAHAGPRWAAEEVSLGVDEATLFLEREMQAAYASFSTQGAPQAATLSQEAASPVVEAAAETMPAAEPESSAPASAFAMASAAAAGDGTSIVTAAHSQTPTDNSPIDSIDLRHAVPTPESTGSTTVLPAELAHAATDTLEGDIMAASWKNIRDSIAGAAPKPAPLKEEFRESEPAISEHDAIETRPASESTRFSASDPKAIANIVDSVLAELRPKIVEEIARKLADPKKD